MDPITLDPQGIAVAQKYYSIFPYSQTRSDTSPQTQSTQIAGVLQRFVRVLVVLPYARLIQCLMRLAGGFGA